MKICAETLDIVVSNWGGHVPCQKYVGSEVVVVMYRWERRMSLGAKDKGHS